MINYDFKKLLKFYKNFFIKHFLMGVLGAGSGPIDLVGVDQRI